MKHNFTEQALIPISILISCVVDRTNTTAKPIRRTGRSGSTRVDNNFTRSEFRAITI